MDAKPALDPHQDHLDRLQEFGYNEQEARFLYLPLPIQDTSHVTNSSASPTKPRAVLFIGLRPNC